MSINKFAISLDKRRQFRHNECMATTGKTTTFHPTASSDAGAMRKAGFKHGQEIAATLSDGRVVSGTIAGARCRGFPAKNFDTGFPHATELVLDLGTRTVRVHLRKLAKIVGR